MNFIRSFSDTVLHSLITQYTTHRSSYVYSVSVLLCNHKLMSLFIAFANCTHTYSTNTTTWWLINSDLNAGKMSIDVRTKVSRYKAHDRSMAFSLPYIIARSDPQYLIPLPTLPNLQVSIHFAQCHLPAVLFHWPIFYCLLQHLSLSPVPTTRTVNGK